MSGEKDLCAESNLSIRNRSQIRSVQKKASGEIAALVQKRCFENRLVMEKGGRNGAVMRCLCALNVTMEDLEKALDIIEKVIIEVDLEQK